jgi:SAM-dependent methyltransferase
MVNDLNLTDMETCYKAVRADVLKRLRLTSDRFGFEPEVTARLVQWGARIYEVPISYHGRTYAEGKNIGWRDGIEALWLILKFRFIDTRATNDDQVVLRQSLGRAPRFRGWVLESFAPYIGERVLEVNAGPGNTTEHLLLRRRLVVTDSDPVHVETLQRRFGHLANVETLVTDFAVDPSSHIDPVDTALVFDGLQRWPEPKAYLANVASVVASGGYLLIQVPAHERLYGPTDKAAGHERRFEREELENTIRSAGIELIHLQEFNRIGAIGWRVNHAIGSGRITPFVARSFDILVPFARRVDATLPGRGLSWLAVARVP